MSGNTESNPVPRWLVVSKDPNNGGEMDDGNENDMHGAFASVFSENDDPLSQHSDQFYEISADPFNYFIETVLKNDENIESEETLKSYRRTYDQWRDYMGGISDRHPACPKTEHVRSFIGWRRDVHNNTQRTIKGKISRLSRTYEYWQRKENMPHPKSWNPFEVGPEEADFGTDPDKKYPDVDLDDLRAKFCDITNIRQQAIIGQQLKHGLRATEICNLKISEVHISHQELQQEYPDLGSAKELGDHTNVVYIPSDRDGNKSTNPKLLPIDDELRWLLINQLLIRPNVDEPWVFLSKRSFTQMDASGVNKEWKKAFHPEYAGTADLKPVTSHFGRHWFSSYWRLTEGMQREHVQYMRGDSIQPEESPPDTLDTYLHPKYAHIEDEYRQNIFKLNLAMQRDQVSTS